MTCLVDHVHEGTKLFWTQELANKWVATASVDRTVILWDAANGAMVHQWVTHSYKAISTLAFSPDSQYLASGGDDAKVKVWNLAGDLHEGPELIATLEGDIADVDCAAWSPRGDMIVFRLSSTIQLWDARVFCLVYVLKHPDNKYFHLIALSPDGRWLVSGSSFGYCIWDVATGSLHKSVLVEDGFLRVTAAVFDSRSMRLVVAEHDEVNLVDVETGEVLAGLKGSNGARDVAFSPDGNLVLTLSNDGMVKLWDTCTGVELFSLEGHKQKVNQARFSPCGKYVASASEDGTVRLWKTRDGSLVTTLSEHGDSQVHCVAFTPDGETL
ncbi:hypothetical protein GSI_01531 [Ganoderma sinense ZZ0214-1]|uniref:Uncharacterized protein n=1 Tax=Ganoderma sinense ZZ0214-1 TaxID=1077348 RepID=A0A2G8SQ21_9APHY|nr:hypothetical protein GSI_01531 [Ganoderma sinense ZZ0214-1]